MASNRGVAYIKPGVVEVQDIDFPKLELSDGPGVHRANVGRKCEHGVSKGRLDEHLWFGSAHGTRSHHCSYQPHPGTRDHR